VELADVMLGIELKAKLGDEIELGLQKADVQKVENHAHSVALFAMYYNFVRIHKTLRTTPAMAAGVTKRLWEVGDMVDVLEAWEQNHDQP
jgi:hypothetical protein